MTNYYILLGVREDADSDTIRSAFRTLARRYHPDAGQGSSADRFREILAAYETLNDPNRREHYDRVLQNKRASILQFVEPLRAQAAPEPMLGRRTVYEPLRSTRLDELIEELFQSWSEVLFDAPRRRDRV
jgi:curved DNA-binding protein CbpA